MFVVSVILGKSLLENDGPQGSVRANLGEQRFVCSIIALLKRKVVIDNDGVGNTKSPEVDAVDTLRVEILCLVEEDLLHAAGEFSNRRGGSQEPAVAKRALVDVVGRDTIAEEGLAFACERLAGALPHQIVREVKSFLAHVFPVKRGLVMGEFLV